jgi:hypothetical protein
LNRAQRIACFAHAYRLLARRPELWTHDRRARLAHAAGEHATCPYSLLDTVLVTQAGELDILCAYAVTLIRTSGRRREMLDLLGILDPDRIVAIYYALPNERRSTVRGDPVWAYQLQRAPHPAIEEALAEWDRLDPEPMSRHAANVATAALAD